MKSLIRELDRVFSLYIRSRDNGVCFTCGKQGNIGEMQCGHFIDRRHMATRFDEENCNCQCRQCNQFLDGNLDEYEAALRVKYGSDIIEKLHNRSQSIRKFLPQELEDMIANYSD
ncbi:MAG: recombination protein NinG [Candidatus Paceibacterota bacterium]|jgi:hypothetical protein